MLLLLLALAWLNGSVVAALGWPIWLALASVALTPWWGWGRPRLLWLPVVLLLVATSMAATRWFEYRAPTTSPTDVSHFIGNRPVTVRGFVDGDRDERARTLVLHLDVSNVRDDRGALHPATGVVLLRLPLSLEYEDGDALEARGKLTAPTGSVDFDYGAYLARQGVYTEMDYPRTRLFATYARSEPKHWVVLFRQRLDRGIRSVLPEPEASLGSSIAFGTRRITDPGFSAALNSTDAALIAVATGYNVTVVGLFMFGLLMGIIGRRPAALAGMLFLCVYALLIGFYPSVLRAVVMGIAVMGAALVGRPSGAVRALVVACAVMVAIDPQSLLSLSFPLSLSATGGVALLGNPAGHGMRKLLRIDPDSGSGAAVRTWLADSTGLTMAAVCPGVPVILAVSHTLSSSALPTNLLLFPLVPAITLVSAATAVVGAVWQSGALVLAPCAYLLLHTMVVIVRVSAAVPGSGIRADWAAVPQTAVLLAGLAALQMAPLFERGTVQRIAVRMPGSPTPALPNPGSGPRDERFPPGGSAPQPPGRNQRNQLTAVAVAVVSVVVAALLALVIRNAASGSSASLKLTYLDVGAGSAILVQAGGSRILVDGGPPGDATVQALDARLRPWDRSLNAVVITQRSGGHVGGLPAVLSRYRVGTLVDASAPQPAGTPASVEWRAFEKAATGGKIQWLPHGRSAIEIGAARLLVTPAGQVSGGRPEAAATVELRVGGRSAVLAGDEPASIAADLRTISTTELSEPAVPARVEVLQAGTAARAAADLAAIPVGLRSALVYRTTENRSVEIDLDGHELRVRVGRGPRLGLFGVVR